MSRGWERWDGRRGSGILLMCISNWRKDAKRMEPISFQRCPVPGQAAMITKWKRLPLNIRQHCYVVWCWNIGKGCPETVESPPWRPSEAAWPWCVCVLWVLWVTILIGVGAEGPRSFCQPQSSWDSIKSSVSCPHHRNKMYCGRIWNGHGSNGGSLLKQVLLPNANKVALVTSYKSHTPVYSRCVTSRIMSLN